MISFYDDAGRYVGPRKYAFDNNRGTPPMTLLCRCLRDGSLDADLESGAIVSFARYEVGIPIKVRSDADGYLIFDLHRDVSGRLIRKKDRDGRRRWRMQCRVHRAVKMKAVAVAKATEAGRPESWREYVADIPPRIDVDHLDADRTNNAAANLSLASERLNRNGRELTNGEAAAIADYDPEFDIPF
jgi:hypothetical protein